MTNIITEYKEVTSEEPIAHIWKFLRFYRDVPKVSNEIRKFRGTANGKDDSVVAEQAKQIGYCIRQAEEYFYASSKVELPTRPLLLYYGAVSLSRALVLLRLVGTLSLNEILTKHNHHGLILKRRSAVAACTSSESEAFLSSLQCECYTNSKGVPFGHFVLFYQSLIPGSFHMNTRVRHPGKTAFLRGHAVQVCANLLPLSTLTSRKFNALGIVKTLPELYPFLKELDIMPDLCPGDIRIDVEQYRMKDENGNEKLEMQKATHDFFVDDLSLEQKEQLLDFYSKEIPNITLQTDFGKNIHLRLTIAVTPSAELTDIYYPDVVDDVNDKKFYIINPEAYLTEPISHIILLYCLGMLARYHPHLWMRIIDENVIISELVDTILNVIYRKFPNLILDQITLAKNHFHY